MFIYIKESAEGLGMDQASQALFSMGKMYTTIVYLGHIANVSGVKKKDEWFQGADKKILTSQYIAVTNAKRLVNRPKNRWLALLLRRFYVDIEIIWGSRP